MYRSRKIKKNTGKKTEKKKEERKYTRMVYEHAILSRLPA
jgi:hypothetical protein